MHVVGFSGSPRKNGNSVGIITYMGDVFKEYGITLECVQVGGRIHTGCAECRQCLTEKSQRCVKDDAPVNEWYAKILEADGVILGTPSYASNLNGDTIAFLERMTTLARSGMESQTGNCALTNKVGVAVSPTRRSGAVRVLQHLSNFFVETGMIIPCANEYNITISRERNEYLTDALALKNFRLLAENMAWLMGKLG